MLSTLSVRNSIESISYKTFWHHIILFTQFGFCVPLFSLNIMVYRCQFGVYVDTIMRHPSKTFIHCEYCVLCVNEKLLENNSTANEREKKTNTENENTTTTTTTADGFWCTFGVLNAPKSKFNIKKYSCLTNKQSTPQRNQTKNNEFWSKCRFSAKEWTKQLEQWMC